MMRSKLDKAKWYISLQGTLCHLKGDPCQERLNKTFLRYDYLKMHKSLSKTTWQNLHDSTRFYTICKKMLDTANTDTALSFLLRDPFMFLICSELFCFVFVFVFFVLFFVCLFVCLFFWFLFFYIPSTHHLETLAVPLSTGFLWSFVVRRLNNSISIILCEYLIVLTLRNKLSPSLPLNGT